MYTESEIKNFIAEALNGRRTIYLASLLDQWEEKPLREIAISVPESDSQLEVLLDSLNKIQEPTDDQKWTYSRLQPPKMQDLSLIHI